MSLRNLGRNSAAAAAAAAGVLAIATPVAGASDTTTPAASAPPSVQPPTLTFVPPRVGPLSVDIGPTVINGQMIDPGLHVLMPGVTLPPISWTPTA
jgi:hypothetical protein